MTSEWAIILKASEWSYIRKLNISAKDIEINNLICIDENEIIDKIYLSLRMVQKPAKNPFEDKTVVVITLKIMWHICWICDHFTDPTQIRVVIIKTNDGIWHVWGDKLTRDRLVTGCIVRVLLSESKWSGIVGVDVAIFWVVGEIVVGVIGGHAPLVNSMLSIAISLLQTPITASICI